MPKFVLTAAYMGARIECVVEATDPDSAVEDFLQYVEVYAVEKA